MSFFPAHGLKNMYLNVLESAVIIHFLMQSHHWICLIQIKENCETHYTQRT